MAEKTIINILLKKNFLLESVDVIQSGSSSQLNIRGVYLHVLGDALGSVIVMISALIILFEDGKWVLYVDPAMSVLLVVSVSCHPVKQSNSLNLTRSLLIIALVLK